MVALTGSDVPAAEEVGVVLAVSSAVAEGGDLLLTLEQIASAAVRLAAADAAAVILREGQVDGPGAIAASRDLDRAYADHLNRVRPLDSRRGPSWFAADDARPVVIADTSSADEFPLEPLLQLREYYGAMASVPIRSGAAPAIGVVNVYRRESGLWQARAIDLLSLLADHAAIAVRTAHLLEGTQRQVDGLSLMVRSLRTQAHEHANRLHAIHGLLVLGAVDEAKRLIESIEEGSHGLYGRITTRIENPTLAGFLLAESAVARERGIELALHSLSRLSELPKALDDLDAVALLANLIGNALERAGGPRASRRRVVVRMDERAGVTSFQVRDWGRGSAHEQHGKSSRPGIGLALAHHIVNRLGGTIEVRRLDGGGLIVTTSFPS